MSGCPEAGNRILTGTRTLKNVRSVGSATGNVSWQVKTKTLRINPDFVAGFVR